MKLLNKALVSAAVLATSVATSALAEVDGPQVRIDIDGSDQTATDKGLTQNLQVQLRAALFENSDPASAGHKAHALWNALKAKLTNMGATQALGDAGESTVGARLSFSAWPSGKSLLKEGTQADAWTLTYGAVNEVAREFRNFNADWDTLTPAERRERENDFLRFHQVGSANYIRASWICAALPYAAEVQHSLKAPAKLQALQNELCNAQGSNLVQLTYVANDWGTSDENPPRFPATPNQPALPPQVLQSRYFETTFIGLRYPYERICGVDAMQMSGYSSSLVEAGWIDHSLTTAAGIPLSDAIDACRKTVATKLAPVAGDALVHYARKGNLDTVGPWLKEHLRPLAEARKSEWTTAAKLGSDIAGELTSRFTLAHGYTQNRFVLDRDLNIANAMEAARDGLTGPSLVGKLFAVETPAQRESPWLLEVRNAPETERKAYLAKLAKAATSTCKDGQVEMSCLASSLGAFTGDLTPYVEVYQNGQLKASRYALLVD